MKEILFSQVMQGKTIKGVLRIIREILYYKYNDSTYAQQALKEYEKKGVKVTFSARKDWIKVDLFSGHEIIKLRDKELVIEESTNEQIEEFLCNFYASEYKKLGYHVEVI